MVGSKGRSPQFLRRVQNRPALRRKSDLAVFGQLMLVVSGLAVGGAIAYFGHDYVTRTQQFRLREIIFDAVPTELEAPIRERLAVAQGANLLTTDLEPLRARVEEIPQIRQAHLRKILPDKVEIRVDLREPWAVLQAADGTYLVSRDAIVLRAAERPSDHLPRLAIDAAVAEHLDDSRQLPSSLPGAAAFDDAVRTIEWLNATDRNAFGTIDHLQLDPDGLVLMLKYRPWSVLLGEATDLAAKADNFRALIATAAPEPGQIIDLRFHDMVVVSDARPSTPLSDPEE